jgi:hypothetical protein
MVRFDRPRVRERTPDQRELDAFIAGEPRWRPEISVEPRRGLRRRGYRRREGRVVGDEALILLDPFVGEALHRRRRRCCREGCELDVRDGGAPVWKSEMSWVRRPPVARRRRWRRRLREENVDARPVF